MTICVLIRSTTFHNKSGGLETQNKTLCEGFVKEGHSVVVISTLFHLGGGRVMTKCDGVRYFFADAPSGVYSKKWWEESVRKFKELNREYNFDVVISQSSAGKSVFEEASHIKKLAVCHGTAVGELKTRFKSIRTLRNIARFLVKDLAKLPSWYLEDFSVFKNSDKIVCVSSSLAESVKKEYFPFKRKVFVVNNGVDEGKFKTQNSKLKAQDARNRFALLYVGRVVKEKGIGELIKAVSRLRENIPNLKLVVVGAGKGLEEFKKLSKAENVKDVVNYVGEVGNNEVVQYYKEADVFVYPSLRQEGFPMVLAEAMVAGIPIVASAIGGISSVVVNKRTGLLVAPRDIDALAKAVLSLYKDKSLRGRLSANAEKKAKKDYSQKAMVREYLNLLS